MLGHLTLYETRSKSIIAIAFEDHYLIRHNSEHCWKIAEHLAKIGFAPAGNSDRPGFLKFAACSNSEDSQQITGTPALELWRAWRRAFRQRSRLEFSVLRNKQWTNIVDITLSEGNLFVETSDSLEIVESSEILVWSQPNSEA